MADDVIDMVRWALGDPSPPARAEQPADRERAAFVMEMGGVRFAVYFSRTRAVFVAEDLNP